MEICESSIMDGNNIFDGFDDIDFFGDDFFEVSKKKSTKAAGDSKVKSEEKKAEKKEKAAGKGKKASAGKGNKGGNFDCDVTLPVQIYARGFQHVYTGNGKLKMSQIADKLVEDGFNQLLIKSMGLVYLEKADIVYVIDGMIAASDDDTLVDLSEGKSITVVDGQLKAEFSLADFEGKDEDEVSLKDVAEKFGCINYNYAGCRLFYDEEAALAYPIMTKIVGTQKLPDSLTVIKNGYQEQYEEDCENDFSGFLKRVCGEGIESYISKSDNAYFVGYSHGKHKYYSKNAGIVTSRNTKKAEKKYPLPLDLYIITWNMHYELTSDMFDGAEKVTTEQITKVMATKQRMFADSERKIDYFYNTETGMMSCMFISGKKGAVYGTEEFQTEKHTGPWKLIRSEAELLACKAKEQYLGLYCEGNEHFKLVALPHGNFLGFFGKELECCDVKKVAFERKLPKIDRSILDHIIAYFRTDLSVEMMVKVMYNKHTEEFMVVAADGEKTKHGINYDFYEKIELLGRQGLISVMEIHSHNTMPARFSPVDDEDEQYPGVFGVIGHLHLPTPSMKFRCGLDGVFSEIRVSELFEY